MVFLNLWIEPHLNCGEVYLQHTKSLISFLCKIGFYYQKSVVEIDSYIEKVKNS